MPPPASRSISPAVKVEERVETASERSDSSRSIEEETGSNGVEEEEKVEQDIEQVVERLKL